MSSKRSLILAMIIAITAAFLETQPEAAVQNVVYADHRPNAEIAIPRKILALYDESDETTASSTRIHRWLETPLNHLGYVLTYSDVGHALPAIQNDDTYAAVVTWFGHPLTTQDERYAIWAASVANAGKKTIILGNLGVGYWSTAFRTFEQVLSHLGLRHSRQHIDLTYGTTIIQKQFSQQASDPVIPPYPVLDRADTKLNILLELRTPPRYGAKPAIIVATGRGGGYAAADFEIQNEPIINRTKWLFDPLSFLESSLDEAPWPRPDITTLGGRRIWINQVCGDLSEFPIEEGKPRSLTSVLLNELDIKSSKTPITVYLTPDLLAKARGDQFFRHDIRQLLSEKNIEAALSVARDQAMPLSDPPALVPNEGAADPVKIAQTSQDKEHESEISGNIISFGEGYNRVSYPTFADIPPLTTSRQNGYRINIAPQGGCETALENHSGSEEIEAIRSNLILTGSPSRLRAANIAFHISALGYPENVNKIQKLLEETRSGSNFPLRTTDYIQMLNDFGKLIIRKNSAKTWRIASRGRIQTVRIDHTDEDIDLIRSHGVLGRNNVRDTLYISLDSAVDEPAITIRKRDGSDNVVGLRESSWEVSHLERRNCGWGHIATGFGPGAFEWYGVKPGVYQVDAALRGKKVWTTILKATENGHLSYQMPPIGDDIFAFNIQCADVEAK